MYFYLSCLRLAETKESRGQTKLPTPVSSHFTHSKVLVGMLKLHTIYKQV